MRYLLGAVPFAFAAALCLSSCGAQESPAVTPGAFLKLVNSVSVTPDATFSNGTLGYIHYVPATQRFVVILDSHDNSPTGKAHYYKEYYPDPSMSPTGYHEYFTIGLVDATTLMVNSTCFIIFDKPVTVADVRYAGWHLERYDATSAPWQKTAEMDIPLELEGTEKPKYQTGGPQMFYLGGLLDLTGEYRIEGGPPVVGLSGSHHHFLDPGTMQLVDEKLVTSPSHFPELSILDLDGSYHLLASSTSLGEEMMAIVFDHQWSFQKKVVLRNWAFFPTGAVTDGQRFYVAYIDTSNHTPGTIIPISQNIRLGVYDSNWAPLDDILVQSYDFERNLQPGGPYLMLHEGHLYLSYYMDNEQVPNNAESQVYVKVYQLL